MTVNECPSCKHARGNHTEDGVCDRLVEGITAGGEGVLTICGRCGWIPMIFDNGTRGWRHEAAGRAATYDSGAVEVEAEDLESALMEVSKILGYR